MLWWSMKGEKTIFGLFNAFSKHFEITDSGTSATEIEVTSYVLLALLEYNTNENLAHAHSIVRWLTSKIGPHGGFKSTQVARK